MDVRAQRISLWITPLFGGILLIAFVSFPGFFPPMSPELTAEQVADFYAPNAAMVRFSMITFNLCAIMLVPFFMTIVVQIKRMVLPSHLLAYCYLCGIAGGATLFAIADIFWLIAAFRPDRNPQLIQLLNDMAWLVFTAPVGMVVVANLCLALAVFLDIGVAPIFSAVGRIRQHRDRGGDDPGRLRGDLQNGSAGMGWRSVLLAANRRVRAQHRRDVRRPSCRDQPSGVRGRRRRAFAECVGGQGGAVSGALSTEPPATVPAPEPAHWNRIPKVDQRIAWWTIPIFYNLFGLIFVVLTRVMPPPRPDVGPAQIVDFFHVHSLTIWIGFAILMVVVGFTAAANGLIALQIKRMSVAPVFRLRLHRLARRRRDPRVCDSWLRVRGRHVPAGSRSRPHRDALRLVPAVLRRIAGVFRHPEHGAGARHLPGPQRRPAEVVGVHVDVDDRHRTTGSTGLRLRIGPTGLGRVCYLRTR
jgi:hypothetical protein